MFASSYNKVERDVLVALRMRGRAPSSPQVRPRRRLQLVTLRLRREGRPLIHSTTSSSTRSLRWPSPCGGDSHGQRRVCPDRLQHLRPFLEKERRSERGMEQGRAGHSLAEGAALLMILLQHGARDRAADRQGASSRRPSRSACIEVMEVFYRDELKLIVENVEFLRISMSPQSAYLQAGTSTTGTRLHRKRTKNDSDTWISTFSTTTQDRAAGACCPFWLEHSQ